jgi:hypothetical protein
MKVKLRSAKIMIERRQDYSQRGSDLTSATAGLIRI